MLAQAWPVGFDGYEVIALDRFGDVDLRAIAPGFTAPSNDALAALAVGVDADAVVYGGGLENRPDLVRRLSDSRELLGTPPELLAAVRDPWAIGAAARAAGARAPDTRSANELASAHRETAGPAMWLRKPRHGGGGRGVRGWAGGAAAPDRAGAAPRPWAVLLRGGDRQWRARHRARHHRTTAPPIELSVVQGHLPRLPEGERGAQGQLRAVCDEVAARFGVRGAFGVDAHLDGRQTAWVLEVNPNDRPPDSSCSDQGASRHTSAGPADVAFPPPARRPR